MRREPFEAGDVIVVVVSAAGTLKNADHCRPSAARQQGASEARIQALGQEEFVHKDASAAFVLREHSI